MRLAIGKQLVYHALQDTTEGSPTTDPSCGQQHIQGLHNKVTALKTSEKQLRERLAVLSAHIPTTTLRDQVAALEREKASLTLTISGLSSTTECVSVEEMDRVQQDWQKWKRLVESRREIFREFWGKCTEVLPPDTTEEELKVCQAVVFVVVW
jgi:26S proteasome regulatory subunit (ATPase 3-interacting protein)